MKRVYLGLMPSSLLLVGSLLIPFQTNAQVTPDGTLSTTVTSPDGSNFTIEGGNRPNNGGNLFHSFQDFSVPTNGSAVFNNANDIANIISRVTGGNFSSIDGLIKANGNANLFLINPAGIIFGENARLDIGGSFFGSTADSVLFPESEFSAVDTQAEPLLTINIPIGLRFRDNPQPIINVSVADNVGLQVKPGETLGLIGGNVFLGLSDLSLSGKITAPGSNIELGGLLSTGTVTIEDDFEFSFPEGVDRADVSFNSAEIDVASDGGGAITINAGNIEMEGDSQLVGGISEGLGNSNSQAGDITANATGDINLNQSSRMQNQVEANATGNAGSIEITTSNLSLTDGSQLLNRVIGEGNSGVVKIITSGTISIDGENSSGRNSGIFSNVSSGAIGNARGVEITTTNLTLTNGGTVSSSTFAQGDGGTVTINAADTISIDGEDREGFNSGIFSTVQEEAIGNAGGVEITTTNLTLTNGGTVSSSTFAQGNAGTVTINAAGTIALDGEDQTGFNSGIFNTVSSGAVGNTEGIEITTTNLTLTNGGTVSSSIFAQGDTGKVTINAAGSISIDDQAGFNSGIFSNVNLGAVGNTEGIEITTTNLTLTNGGTISSSVLGEGNAGEIKITAKASISLAGLGEDSTNVLFSASPIGSIVGPFAIGNGADITINTSDLSISNSAIATSTVGKGNAGNILINVTDSLSLMENSQLQAVTGGEGNGGNIVINGENADIFLSDTTIGTSVIFLSDFVLAPFPIAGSGQGGDIKITGRTLSVRNRASLLTTTVGKAIGERLANAGNIQIDISDSIIFDGGSQLLSNTFGQGNAGNVTINAGGAVSFDDVNSSIESGILPLFSEELAEDFTQERQGGNINIVARSLSVKNGASLNTSSFGRGNAGNITLDIQDAVTFSGFGSNNSGRTVFSQARSTLEKGAEGTAGNIEIKARSLLLEDGAVINSSTFGQGDSGIVSITTEEAVILSGAGTFIFNNVERGGTGNSQGISIEAQSLSVTEGAQIQTLVREASVDNIAGVGNAGDININVRDTVNFSGVGIDNAGRTLSSQASSRLQTGTEGNAGNINIKARSLSLENRGQIDSSVLGKGNAGIINIETTDSVFLNGGFVTSLVGSFAIGNGADITINTPDLSMANLAVIGTSTFGKGNAGDILINATDLLSITEKSQLQAITANEGNGGNITINTSDLSISNSTIATSTGGKGNAGNILINVTDLLSIIEKSQLQAITANEGNGGNIIIDAENANISLSDVLISTSVFLLSNDFNDFIDISAIAGNGQGGDIKITGRTLTANDGTSLITSADGKAILERLANAGNIQIDISDSIIFDGGSQLLSNTAGQGNAGHVTINAGGNIFFEDINTRIITGIEPLSEELEKDFTQERQGGDINISARSLSVTNGASLNTSSSGRGNAGNITLDIQDTVTFSGFGSNSSGRTVFSQARSTLEKGAEGKAGDINISARSLLLEDRGRINNTTSGIGNAGDININVDDSIHLFRSSTISNSVGQGSIGNGGELDIQANSLTLTEGSQIITGVFRAGFNIPGGKGTGGDIRITTTDFVDISGVDSVQLNIPDFSNDPSNTTGLFPTAGFSSGLFAATQRGATGEGGNITVTTDAFRIADGAVVDNSTTNNSNAGDITVNANSFEATGGGQIITATRGGGDAADIKLNITDRILISGSDPNFTARLARAEEFGTVQGGDNIVTNQGAASGVFANTSAGSTGDGGNIDIGIFKQEGENLTLDTNQFTQDIILANGAKIAADSQGGGSGGAISIQAQDFTLDDRAEILAETEAQQENNNALSEINLGVANILQLKNDSRISTQALSNADGGNINIDAKFIVAFPGQNEGNDILTRAAQGGDGGNINITTEALFGIEERKATPGNRTNDIDASSEFGLSGEVIITRPDVDPASGLLELTQEVVDPADLIAQNVCTQTADSEFVDIGKGGLPQNPEDRLTGDAIEVGLVQPITSSGEKMSVNREITAVKPKTTRKPPAQGWIFHENGIVELVAYNPHRVGEQRTWDNPRGCQ